MSPSVARKRLDAARQARATSARRAANPAGLILSVSFFCGALTLAPAHQPLGSLVTILAVLWFAAELLLMSARNQWRALRAMPRPRWSLLETTLMCLAMLLGGFVGPHLLASNTHSTFVSWGLAGAVMVAVAVLLFSANASYRHRSS
jgi:hypothetical protein